MNNRYICRGKRKDNDEWVEGVAIFTNNKAFILNNAKVEFIKGFNENRLNFVLVEVIPETVGQCTGLEDKNGKLIFEGDIVSDKESGLFGKVISATTENGFDGMAGFMVDDVDDGLQNYNGFWYLVEVIGNIHDNPELLEVER
nr:MAG TPA: YopX protein [Caudoviricetes sp.]